MLLIGGATTLFTFQLYARTTNEVIGLAARTVEYRIRQDAASHLSLEALAPRLTADLARPRVRVAVYDDAGRVLSETGPIREPMGVEGAVISLMSVRRVRIPLSGGFVIVAGDLNQMHETLRAYWTWLLPVGLFAVVLAWAAAVAITRQAVSPLTQISAAMRRVALGDFRPEPIRPTSADEIGELAHSFNGAIQQVQSALAQRDRTEAEIRQFIADAGHELRTPLTVIMGYLDVLDEGALEAPQVRGRVIASMRQESRRMRTLIEKLICLARLERSEPALREIVDVSAAAERVVSALPSPDAAARVHLATAPDARVVADASDVTEAIRNLVDNALKYAPGSDVGVSTAVHDDEVVVVVRDGGPGMSEQEQAHAFDRFYRGRASADVDGSGLGLAIVQRAVQRSGGTIALESRADAGTRFTIRLPRAT
jgi:two-component system OmpR family sensor kinase